MSNSESSLSPEGPGGFFSHRALSSVPWTILNKFVTFAIFLAVSAALFRFLGKEKYGSYALCKSLYENLQVICALGLNTAIVRFIPELYTARNRAGILRLITRAGLMQGVMVIAMIALVYFATPLFDRAFGVTFGISLVVAVALAGALMAKDLVYDIFTAMFQVRIVSMLSILQGVLWLTFILIFLRVYRDVSVALGVQIASLGLTLVPGGYLLWKLFRGLRWQSPAHGIGKRRTLNTSLPSMLSAIGNMVLQRYSEIYFVGILVGPAAAGLYENACGLPFIVITFLPLALQKLFTAALAEAYTADPHCLGRLVSGMFKAMILLIMPVSAFGAFFAPDLALFLYGPEMEPALMLTSLFFLFHVLPLISVPLSMAIITKEKILHMTPTTLFQIGVNLLLDYFLIKHYGMYGAIAAVFLTFVITIPIRLYMVHRLVGGIFFPGWFFFKITAVLFALAGAFSLLAGRVNILALIALAAAYAVSYVFLLRYLRLIRPEDVADLRAMGYAKLNRVLDFLAGAAHA